jgi:hypothetical protein
MKGAISWVQKARYDCKRMNCQNGCNSDCHWDKNR